MRRHRPIAMFFLWRKRPHQLLSLRRKRNRLGLLKPLPANGSDKPDPSPSTLDGTSDQRTFSMHIEQYVTEWGFPALAWRDRINGTEMPRRLWINFDGDQVVTLHQGKTGGVGRWHQWDSLSVTSRAGNSTLIPNDLARKNIKLFAERLQDSFMPLVGKSLTDHELGFPTTVKQWLRFVTCLGIDAALATWEARALPRAGPQRLQADPASLRDLAVKEKRRPRRKQMLALALVAEGMTPHAAALATGANYASVLRRIRRFPKEGIAAFHDKERWCKRLAAYQSDQLRAAILKRPDMNYRELRELVQARFGVRYSVRGLRLLLKRDLGIVRSDRRFIDVSAISSLAPDAQCLSEPSSVMKRDCRRGSRGSRSRSQRGVDPGR
jgi:transposase